MRTRAYDIDFLTPSFDDDLKPTHLESLNVWAQGLHYLDFLIKDPMPAVSIYMEGLLVQVPRPERYAVHKLIVSQKRQAGSGVKARKDLQQARAIIWAMAEDRGHEIKAAIAEADSRGERWREALDQALDLQINPTGPTRCGTTLVAVFRQGDYGAQVRLDFRQCVWLNFSAMTHPNTAKQKRHRNREIGSARLFRTNPSPSILSGILQPAGELDRRPKPTPSAAMSEITRTRTDRSSEGMRGQRVNWWAIQVIWRLA